MPKNTKIDRLMRRVADAEGKLQQAPAEMRQHRQKILNQRVKLLRQAQAKKEYF